jgi:hypothetical protein
VDDQINALVGHVPAQHVEIGAIVEQIHRDTGRRAESVLNHTISRRA